MTRFDVVIPTTGRPSLQRLITALDGAPGPRPGRVLVVDDRAARSTPLLQPPVGRLRVEVLPGRAAGPAAARNVGWRASDADWVAFLDDDVLPPPDWADRLVADLERAQPDVAGVQGRIRVPLPAERRPTDWERNVAGLEHARWATADLCYRRAELERVGGFDERFPRAYREDSDIGLRLADRGRRIERGDREVEHPVGEADWRVSLRLQRGNADDVRMRRLHGAHWRERAGAPAGRLKRHVAVTVAGALALVPGPWSLVPRKVAGLAWWAGTAELAWKRIAPGPRTPREVLRMVTTSALMPPVATYWWVRGHFPGTWDQGPGTQPPEAVLLDRDGTLIHDVPYNGDPARVEPVPGAREAVERLRGAGVKLAVISNQSGVARGLITREDVDAVNARVEELFGPIGPWLVCPHGPDEGCACRKPAPGLVIRAAQTLGVSPERCAVLGDIGADVDAARAAGARGVLVPNARTRHREVSAATEKAATLDEAVDLLLGARA